MSGQRIEPPLLPSVAVDALLNSSIIDKSPVRLRREIGEHYELENKEKCFHSYTRDESDYGAPRYPIRPKQPKPRTCPRHPSPANELLTKKGKRSATEKHKSRR
ncbi:hypothetical protein L3Y34_010979 [Caenorhabditis briggsae]|uniref:Uncharacterized protein n=1 Tax=Caenorhabditis briggsae TaxID=6238 RepID=A0AAE8ZKU2_CAEBR|nr:hypothetical protein L3Y34_010979 [Caenorhabditis briggsae]